MRMSRPTGRRATVMALTLLLTVILATTAARPARAETQLIANGGFDAGLSGWFRLDQVGSDGEFRLQSGTVSPITGTTVPPPPGGGFAAMSDGAGPGAHLLYQDFVVPTGDMIGTLSFSLFVGNRAGVFATPATLDFSITALNQQARVDIILPGANPFSVSASDVLLNAFQTSVGSPLVTGYNNFSINVSSLIATRGGQTLRLRFAETDNINLFQFGVDNVSLISAIPEPSSVVILGSGLMGVLVYVRGRRRKPDSALRAGEVNLSDTGPAPR